jgi:hypothetical protein
MESYRNLYSNSYDGQMLEKIISPEELKKKLLNLKEFDIISTHNVQFYIYRAESDPTVEGGTPVLMVTAFQGAFGEIFPPEAIKLFKLAKIRTWNDASYLALPASRITWKGRRYALAHKGKPETQVEYIDGLKIYTRPEVASN